MYMVYDIKNGVKYGRYVKSRRVDGKAKQESLNIGRVLDEEGHVFFSR